MRNRRQAVLQKWDVRLLFGSGMMFTVILLSLAMARSASAMVPAYTIDDLTRNATDVVVGTIADESAAWEPWGNGGTVIVTLYTLVVDETIKGSAGRAIQVAVPGGRVGDTRMAVSCAPHLSAGQRVVLFLKKDLKGRPRYWPFGLERGTMNVDSGEIVHPQAPDLEATPLSSLKAQVVRTLRAMENDNH